MDYIEYYINVDVLENDPITAVIQEYVLVLKWYLTKIQG